LDLGCGVGHSYDLLSPRITVGVDIDLAALAGQARETHVADMRCLPFPPKSFASVLSVQSLEHVPDPERAVQEAARVMEPGGVAVFVTPNRLTFGRPDEVIDPYHHVEFDAQQLRDVCAGAFRDVEVRGIFGSPRYLSIVAAERHQLDVILRLDPFRLRRGVPRFARQRLYDRLLARHRLRPATPAAAAVAVDDFALAAGPLDDCLDLVAICRQPVGDQHPLPAPSRDGPAILVMPAYNAAATLAQTYERIPHEVVDLVILVDDASRDSTLDVARKLDLQVIAHPHNVGYGGNQKTCYMEALRRGAQVVVMLHPDGQYDPSFIGQMVTLVRDRGADVVLGSRMLSPGQAQVGGMPRWKRRVNRTLTGIENSVLGLQLSEYHTGYRAYSRRFLETVPFMRNSNDFAFDSEILVQAHAFGFQIVEIPVSTRYHPEASSVGLGAGTVYGLKTLAILGRYALHRLGIRSRLFEH
jgi:hypothetical protein